MAEDPSVPDEGLAAAIAAVRGRTFDGDMWRARAMRAEYLTGLGAVALLRPLGAIAHTPVVPPAPLAAE